MNDQWPFGIQEWYSPSVLNSGADGWFTTGNRDLHGSDHVVPNGVGMYDLWRRRLLGARHQRQRSIAPLQPVTVAAAAFPGGVPYQSYWNWDAGLGFTWKAFTLDLRYYDTNLTKAQCNVFTSDQTATFRCVSVTALNPGGLASNWCSATFIAKLSFATNLSSIK